MILEYFYVGVLAVSFITSICVFINFSVNLGMSFLSFPEGGLDLPVLLAALCCSADAKHL